MSILSIILGFLVVWGILLASMAFFIVKAGTIAVIFRFGDFLRVKRPGLGGLIPLVDTIERHSTQTYQDELPDEPENIDRIHDIPEGDKVLPFRVMQSGMQEAVFYIEKEPGHSPDPDAPLAGYREVPWNELGEFDENMQASMKIDSLHAPLTSEIAVVVEWYLDGEDEDSIRHHIENVIPEEGRCRRQEVKKRMMDMCARSLQELLGPLTLGHARDMMEPFSLLIKKRLEILVGERPRHNGKKEKPWGIHIKDAYIKSIHPGRTINEARAKAGAAVSDAQAVIRSSEATAQATRNQADADEYKEIKKGKGEAGRMEQMIEVMKNPDAKFLAALDVTETVVKEANYVIVPQEGGVAATIAAIVKGTTETFKAENK